MSDLDTFLRSLPKAKKRKKSEPPPPKAEESAEEEISELKRAFIARAEAEDKRYVMAVDSEYWLCLCFQSRAQKNEFLQKIGLTLYGNKYLDGRRVATKLGIALKPVSPFAPLRPADKRLAALVKE